MCQVSVYMEKVPARKPDVFKILRILMRSDLRLGVRLITEEFNIGIC
jgi:hypothetical protein